MHKGAGGEALEDGRHETTKVAGRVAEQNAEHTAHRYGGGEHDRKLEMHSKLHILLLQPDGIEAKSQGDETFVQDDAYK